MGWLLMKPGAGDGGGKSWTMASTNFKPFRAGALGRLIPGTRAHQNNMHLCGGWGKWLGAVADLDPRR